MSTAELLAIVAANAQTTADLRKSQSGTDLKMQASKATVDEQLKELGKHIGGLANKLAICSSSPISYKDS